MRPARLLPFVLPFLAGPALAQPSAWNDWTAFYRDFSAWGPDSTQVATVASLPIERDACTLLLEEGRLALATPLGGRRTAAVFVGRGTLSFTPRSEIERQQLRRFYSTTALRRRFTRLTLVFSDTTLAELRSVLAFHADTLGALRRAWLGTVPYLTVRRIQTVRPLALAQMLLDGDDNGLFWAQVSDVRGGDPLFFSLDPTQSERVLLQRQPDNDRAGLVRFYNAETVCQSFAAGDPDTLRQDVVPAYDVQHYALEAAIAQDLTLRTTATLDLRARGRARAWLGFVLPSDLKLDAVTSPGRNVSFHQERDNDLIWVHVDPPLAPGETVPLAFRYAGECFERAGDEIYHRFVLSWYPRPWFGDDDATWDMSFDRPDGLQLVAAGDPVSTLDSGSVHRSTWRIARPVPWASFDVSFMRGVDVKSDSIPPLHVWTTSVHGAGERRAVRETELATGRDDEFRVAHDVSRCLEFYQREFGPALATSFNAVETPLGHYVAYPGLIHMMRTTDEHPAGVEWTPDRVRAHEIAHQWFGLGVRPATYHDAWLSEGFANFCALWYLQAGRQDARHYLELLENWRRQMLENRRFPLGGGQQAGPIWLGHRTNSSRTEDDYHLIIYTKGAWVLHMLRNYLLPDDPGETRFRGLLRDFYTRYAGRSAFTEDFRAEVEHATGEDMGWFFDQWVYGTDVPTYRFTWTAEPAGQGQWRVKGHVIQTNVPATFRMPVMVRVNFGRDAYMRQRVWVNGPSTDFDLPPVPSKPTDIVFNDLESVLCEVLK
jgi:hypothetical protein